MCTLLQYGLYRAGTNYARYMLEKNIDQLAINYIHKHKMWSKIDNIDGTIICTKHPCSWVASMKKFRRQFVIEDVILEHNKKLVSWFQNAKNMYHLKYENLFLNTKKTLDEIVSFFGLHKRDILCYPENKMITATHRVPVYALQSKEKFVFNTNPIFGLSENELSYIQDKALFIGYERDNLLCQ